MRVCRRWSLGIVVIALVALAIDSPVHAWYGHRNYRSNRVGRGYTNSRLAAAQRASSALNSARARLSMAQVNAARQVRQARQQAFNAPVLTSAKSAYTRATHDYEAAKGAVVARLKETNPEFRNLLADAQSKRSRIAALAKAGDESGERQSLESQLKTTARKIVAIQNPVIDNDPAVKQIVSRKGDLHSTAQSAEKDAQNAVSKDPRVLAAQKQLSQAQLQAQQAAARYNNAMASANNGGLYGRGRYSHRRSGYGGYGMYAYGIHNSTSHRSYRPAHHVRYASAKPVHVHHPVHRRR